MIKIKIYIEKESGTIYTEEEMAKELEYLSYSESENTPFEFWLDDAYEPSEVFQIMSEGNGDKLQEEYKEYIDNKVLQTVNEYYITQTLSTDFYYNENDERVYLDK